MYALFYLCVLKGNPTTMAVNDSSQRDLVLSPGSYAYVQDESKGNIELHVGPMVSNLSAQQKIVKFDSNSKQFIRCNTVEDGILRSTVAPEGWYITLKNPAEGDKAPQSGARNTVPDLRVGHKVQLHGPCQVTPWPGQMLKLRKGHHLGKNEYLVVRVYSTPAALPTDHPDINLAVGAVSILTGTTWSFYMPPTGVEVVPDEYGQYIRQAVTLETMEYAILLSEEGKKRYVYGPDVVFPRPDEDFITKKIKDGSGNEIIAKKFRAYELSPTSGIFVKVTEDYEDNGIFHSAGEEMFVTGDKTPIYWPRAEHTLVKQGDREVHYSTAIPDGEARYVLDKSDHGEYKSGTVRLVKGPKAFLADPRYEVLVRRMIDPALCQLMYPNNQAALAHNQALWDEQYSTVAAMAVSASPAMAAMDMLGTNAYLNSEVTTKGTTRGLRGSAAKDFGGDVTTRKDTYTKPRQITLDSRYEGAVRMSIWAGFAVMLVRASGDRRIVVGPETVHLEYDELPVKMSFSTGTPKDNHRKKQDVYLRTNTRITDIIEVETSDNVAASLKVSFWVRYEPDHKDKWFDIDDPVGLLTDHMRSRIHHAIGKVSIAEFHKNAADIIRNVVLGTNDNGPRPGFLFTDNGMKIYDLDLLQLQIKDPQISQMLVKAARDSFVIGVQLEAEQALLSKEAQLSEIQKRRAEIETSTHAVITEQHLLRRQDDNNLAMAMFRDQAAKILAEHEAALEACTAKLKTVQAQLRINAAESEYDLATAKAEHDEEIRMIEAQTKAAVTKLAAIQPELVSALNRAADAQILTGLTEHFSTQALLGGTSVVDVLKQVLGGTKFAEILPAKETSNGNGKSLHA